MSSVAFRHGFYHAHFDWLIHFSLEARMNAIFSDISKCLSSVQRFAAFSLFSLISHSIDTRLVEFRTKLVHREMQMSELGRLSRLHRQSTVSQRILLHALTPSACTLLPNSSSLRDESSQSVLLLCNCLELQSRPHTVLTPTSCPGCGA